MFSFAAMKHAAVRVSGGSALQKSFSRVTGASATTSRSASDDAAPGTVTVTIDEALSTTSKALEMIGWDKEDASLQAEIMTAAELCGNNQGLVKMYKPEQMAPAAGASKPTVERDTPDSAVVNGNQAPGMLAAVTACDLAADKVSSSDGGSSNNNIAIVSSYNTSTSSGQLAYYVERMAKRKGVIGISLANSPELVAAAAGGKRVYGTNPLAVAVPRAGAAPFTFDMATSAVAFFGVLTAQARGEALPDGVAYGKDGDFSTDPDEVLKDGAIATFGGHKGAGLSLVVELLAGVLSGGAVLGQCESKAAAKSWGHTFIAINPGALVDDFPAKAESVFQTVKASGADVRIPGERSAKTAEERREAGVMPIPEKIWESIQHTAEHGLPKSE